MKQKHLSSGIQKKYLKSTLILLLLALLCRRYSYGGLGEPVYSACYLAVSVDLGDAL